ncbi:hypothetical protein, partial [Rheinheimera aquimaris]|uniref:hypothetical protein n=1 Tax=Rheinheimera aquimaris TaxID=412437 RepID=UPI003A969CB8
ALLAAYSGLARLAALANPNNGELLLIKNYTSQLRYGEPTGTCKTVERSQEEQRYRHHRLQQTHKLANLTIWRCSYEHETRAMPE